MPDSLICLAFFGPQTLPERDLGICYPWSRLQTAVCGSAKFISCEVIIPPRETWLPLLFNDVFTLRLTKSLPAHKREENCLLFLSYNC